MSSLGPVRISSRCFILLGLLILPGCFPRRNVRIAPAPLPDSVVTVVAGREVVLHHPRLEGDSVVLGWEKHSPSDSTLLRVPAYRRVRTFDLNRTLGLLLGIGVVSTAITLVILIDAIISW